MKRLWLAAAFLCLGAYLQADGDTTWHFNLYANYNYQWLTPNSASIWNPDQLVPLTTADGLLFVNPEARLKIGPLRLLLSPVATIDAHSQSETRWREIALTLNCGKIELTLGKALLKLGTGYMFTPISVITPAKTVSDPEDTLRSQDGVYIVKADYYSENWNLSAMAFKKNNWHNIALFGYTTLKGIDFYALLYYPEYQKLEAGAALAATVAEGIEVHAECMMHRRSPVLYHLAYSAANPAVAYRTWPLFQPPDGVYSECLIGSNITYKDINLIAEYYHTDWGLWPSWWENLKAHFAYNIALPGHPLSSPDIGADLTLAASGSRGMMRDYLFARLAKTIGKVSLSSLAFINLADASLLGVLDFSYNLGDGMNCFVRPIFFCGTKTSEFGNGFYASMLQAGFSLAL